MTHNLQGTPHPIQTINNPTFYLICINGEDDEDPDKFDTHDNDQLEQLVGMLYYLLSDKVPRKNPLSSPHIKIYFEGDHRDEYHGVTLAGTTYMLDNCPLIIKTYEFHNWASHRLIQQLMYNVPPNSWIIFVSSAKDLIKHTRIWTPCDYWDNYYTNSRTPHSISRYNFTNANSLIDMWNYVYRYPREISHYWKQFNNRDPFHNNCFIMLTHLESYNEYTQMELYQDMVHNTHPISRIKTLEQKSVICCSHRGYLKYSTHSWWAVADLLKRADLTPIRHFRHVDVD